MSDEIEDFLRRAAARRQQRQGPQQHPAPQPPPQQSPPRPQQQRQPPRRPRPDVQIIDPVAEAEIVQAIPVEDQSVSAYVKDHLNTSDFSERASHLGESVGLADENLDAHLHEVFDHKLGSLGSSRQAEEKRQAAAQAAAKLKARTSAGSIAQMLSSPQSLRNAIVLSEILHRPEDRW